MKTLKSALIILSVLCLSACEGTFAGMKKDSSDFSNWMSDRPSRFGDVVGRVPMGYGDIDREMMSGGPVVKPAGVVMQQDRGAVYVGKADNGVPEGTTGDTSGYQGGVDYNSNVTVFPVDGPETSMAPVPGADGGTGMSGDDYHAVAGGEGQKIFFHHGSSRLDQGDRATIASVAQQSQGRRIVVEGHASKRVDGVTDEMERSLINQRMSTKRANAVTSALQQNGVPADRISTMSYGDSHPNPVPGKLGQEAADRRVEIRTE